MNTALRLLKWLGFIVLLLIAVAVLAALLIVQTEPGTRWAAAQGVKRANAAVPGLAVSYRGLSGALVAGLNIDGLEVVIAAGEGSHRITLDSLQFQWNPFVLRDSLLRVTGLDLRGLDVALASAEAPEPTEEPGDLRATLDTVFSLPLDFLVDQARLRDLVLAMGDTRVEVGEISATALSLDGSGFSAGELRVQAEGYEAAAADLALSAEDLVLGGRLDWRVALPEQPELRGAAELGGSLEQLTLEHRLLAPLAVTTRGTVEPGALDQSTPAFDLVHEVEGLREPIPNLDILEQVTGRLTTGGSLERVTITGDMSVTPSGYEPVAIDLDAVYGPDGLEIANLDLDHPLLGFASNASLTFSPALSVQAAWRLIRLDASPWLPAGLRLHDVAGNGGVSLSMADGLADARFELAALSGRLNDHPLDVSGAAALVDGQLRELNLDLSARDNRVHLEGGLQPVLDLRWRIDAPALDVLLPELAGALDGAGTLSGSLDAPQVNGSLSGSGLAYGDAVHSYTLSSLELVAQYLGTAGDNRIELSLAGLRLPLGEDVAEVDSARLQLRGALDQHNIGVEVAMPVLHLRLAAAGGYDGAAWGGQLAEAALTGDYGDWELGAPTELLLSAERASVAAHCWGFLQTELCAEGAWDAEAGYEAALRLSGLPLALLNSAATVARLEEPGLDRQLRDKPVGLDALQERFGLRPPAQLFVDGVVDLEASARGEGDGLPRIEALVAPSGLRLGLVLEEESDSQTLRPEVQVFGFEDVALDLGHQDGQWRAAASFAVYREGVSDGLLGTLDGSFGLDAAGALDGAVNVDFADIAWVETFAPMLSGTRGELDLRAEIGGDLERPLLLADLSLSGGGFQLADYGLDVHDLALNVHSGADNEITISGSALSGEGRLALDGRVTEPLQDTRRVALSLRGEDFQVMNLDDTRAIISPSLDFTLSQDRLDVRGEVGVPSFLLDLETSDVVAGRGGGVEVSRDVVVVNAPPEQSELLESGASQAVRSIAVTGAVTIALGEDVRFAGYGLDIRLGGNLTVEMEPTRPLLAYGEIAVVEGMYDAYGQELSAEGRLIFLGNPLNPALDMRAFREIPNATVGVQMSGTLRNIQGQLYSTPVLPESEILAILVTGRSFQNVGPQDSDSMLTAIANFGIERGQGITDTVRGKLGLDTLDVSGGSSLDDSSLGLGKYITPDLFLRYDVGLFDRQSSLSLNYSLTERLRLEVQTGVSQSVDLTYTVEK